MGRKIEKLGEDEIDNFIDIEVICLEVLYSDEDKQKCVITDKSESNARLQIGGETGLEYLKELEEYKLEDIQVIQAGGAVSGKDYNAFLIARSESTIKKI